MTIMIYAEMTDDVFTEVTARGGPVKTFARNAAGNVQVEMDDQAWRMLQAIGEYMEKGEVPQLKDGGLAFGISNGHKIYDARAYGDTDDFSQLGPIRDVEITFHDGPLPQRSDFAGLFGETQAFDETRGKREERLAMLKSRLKQMDEMFAKQEKIQELRGDALKRVNDSRSRWLTANDRISQLGGQIEGKMFGRRELENEREEMYSARTNADADLDYNMRDYMDAFECEQLIDSKLRELAGGENPVKARDALVKAIRNLEKEDLER